MKAKRPRDTKRQRQKEKRERVRGPPPSQAVTKALPEGGVSLESSQLGESQAAPEIWGREGGT